MSDQRPIEEKEEEAETWKMGEGIDELPTWHQEEERERERPWFASLTSIMKNLKSQQPRQPSKLVISPSWDVSKACLPAFFQLLSNLLSSCALLSIFIQLLKFMSTVINSYPTSEVHIQLLKFMSIVINFYPTSKLLNFCQPFKI